MLENFYHNGLHFDRNQRIAIHVGFVIQLQVHIFQKKKSCTSLTNTDAVIEAPSVSGSIKFFEKKTMKYNV